MNRFGTRTRRLLAVAMLGTVGTTHAYEWQISDDTLFGIGGSIELAYALEDTGLDHGNELMDNGSGIEFFGEHQLTDGLAVYFSAGFDFNVDDIGDDADGTPFETDHVYLGLRGDYGTLQAGDWDGIYDDNVSDLIDFPEINGPTNAPQTDSGDAIAYMSPSFNGFSFAVQGFFNGDGSAASGQTDADQSLQVVLQYQARQWGVYLGYDDMGQDDGQDATIGIAARYMFDPVTVAVRIESVGADSHRPDSDLDQAGAMLYGMAVAYDYGSGSVAGLVQQVEPKAKHVDSRTELGINVTYMLADSFYIYAEHMRYDHDDHNGNTTGVGLVYEF